MEHKLEFIVYCIEEYKAANHMTGKAIINLFEQYQVIEYIYNYYEALHTTGKQYIINDIKDYFATCLTECRSQMQEEENVSVMG